MLRRSISGAIVILNADGTANVLSSTVEMGQGSETTLAQIVAEELGISVEQIHIVQPDTDVTPYDTITAEAGRLTIWAMPCARPRPRQKRTLRNRQREA